MDVTVGKRLGPYEIVSRIGAGGMGEVFKASDTRLDRSVAIKVLSASFAGNEDLRARFDREARTISQLNHPNICTLYDIGHENGTDYLVMELLEGETLSDRLAKGPLSLGEVLRYGAQIADALALAHRQGVMHRDLKPANVMLTKSGAKLLDFGLAKSLTAVKSGSTPDDATHHKPLTQEGTILGTFQYMAPEQLAGDEADARTDIFALGAVLYEMATGQRAFDGKTRTSLIAQIVAGTPRPLRELQPLTPPAFEHTVEKCLAKEPEERWQSAQDVASELRWMSTLTSPSAATSVSIARPGRRRLAAAVAIAGIVTTVALALVAGYLAKRLVAAERLMRVDIIGEETPAEVIYGAAMISPDGKRIVMVVKSKNGQSLAVRDLSTGETKALAGTNSALFPFWSPDSETVGFFANGKLQTVPALGGAIQTLCDAPEGRGGSWGSRGEIVFTPNIREPIFKVSENGGQPVRVTDNQGTATHRNPSFLPDGKTFLHVVRDDPRKPNGVFAASMDGGASRRVLESSSNAHYSDGYLLFMKSGTLVAQRFDIKSLTLSGSIIPLAETVEFYEPRDVGNFSVSSNGVLLYRQAVETSTQLAWFSSDGRKLGPAGALIRSYLGRCTGRGWTKAGRDPRRVNWPRCVAVSTRPTRHLPHHLRKFSARQRRILSRRCKTGGGSVRLQQAGAALDPGPERPHPKS
ncbi:MAG TPA: protein kinase [Thermoanaerobaculia bacterium]|nr:protein kinase [Thermoanaerobaculia bacterium]